MRKEAIPSAALRTKLLRRVLPPSGIVPALGPLFPHPARGLIRGVAVGATPLKFLRRTDSVLRLNASGRLRKKFPPLAPLAL